MFSDLSAMFIALKHETVVLKAETNNHQKFVSALDAKVGRVAVSIGQSPSVPLRDALEHRRRKRWPYNPYSSPVLSLRFKRSTLAAVFDLSATFQQPERVIGFFQFSRKKLISLPITRCSV
jgi:hypothetical protein